MIRGFNFLLFFIVLIKIKQRLLPCIDDFLSFFKKFQDALFGRGRPYVYSSDYFASLFVAHLDSSRTRSRLEFSDIRHVLIVAHLAFSHFPQF